MPAFAAQPQASRPRRLADPDLAALRRPGAQPPARLIEKKTGIPIETIKESLEHLRRLNLRPSAAFEVEDPHYVVPDLIVESNDQGVYEVRLADQNAPQLAISRDYLEAASEQGNRSGDSRLHPEENPVGPLADRVDRATKKHALAGCQGHHRAPERSPRSRPRVHRAAQDAADRRPRRRARHDRQPGRG